MFTVSYMFQVEHIYIYDSIHTREIQKNNFIMFYSVENGQEDFFSKLTHSCIHSSHSYDPSKQEKCSSDTA